VARSRTVRGRVNRAKCIAPRSRQNVVVVTRGRVITMDSIATKLAPTLDLMKHDLRFFSALKLDSQMG
jgi:hypothetical protein